MEIQGLLRNQKIQIDHQRGSGTPNEWWDSSNDVQIEKLSHCFPEKEKSATLKKFKLLIF